MAGDVVADDAARRCMVARLRTGVLMPCDGRSIDMTGRSGMLRRDWLGCRPRGLRGLRLLDRPWLGCRPRGLRSLRLLGRPCRASAAAVVAMVTAAVAASWRSERRCAECRADDSDECEFHEVVVHSAPSLSVCGFDGELFSPLHQARRPWRPFLTSHFKKK